MRSKRRISRYSALIIIMFLLFSFIGLKLTFIQIVKAEDYMLRANTKSIRQIMEVPPRGKILDRNNIPLAINVQSYTLDYTETEQNKEHFFETFDKVFKLLDESCNSKLSDEFELKVNPFSFEFKGETLAAQQNRELQFKKNRGLYDVVRCRIFKNKSVSELTAEDKRIIEKEVSKISPKDVFDYLIVKYDMYKLLNLNKAEEKLLIRQRNKGIIEDKKIAQMVLNKVPIEKVRKYMVVRDVIYLNSFSNYKPVTVAADISKETAFLFEQLKNVLPGVNVTIKPLRYYPYDELGANFIGYISKISETNRARFQERGYDVSSDYIGTAGLESAFEDRLKGVKGGKIFRVNKKGRKTEELFNLQTYPGQNMVLTIDKRLQAITEKALKDRLLYLQNNKLDKKGLVNTNNATRGAAVVINVNTGEVLSMVSLPGYNPNLFTVPGRLTEDLNKELFNPDLKTFGEKFIKKMGLKQYGTTVDTLFPIDSSVKNAEVRKDIYDIYPKPFLNYATSYPVPPGSTFKALTAVAGLEEGVIDSKTKIKDLGTYTVNKYKGSCWKWNEQHGVHGAIDVSSALEVSCNYFFFDVGNRLYNKGGLDKLAEYSWKFGLGVNPKSKVKPTTGIEITENFGQVYNNINRKDLMAFYSKYYMVEAMKKGCYVAGNGVEFKFPPTDISLNKDDSTELSKAKEDIKQRVRQFIQLEYSYGDINKVYGDMRRELIPLIKNLVASLPKDKKAAYKQKDIKVMSDALANYVTFDMISQVITPGNVYDASIGQGVTKLTPVQLANYMAAIANGGTRYKVHLVHHFTNYSGKIIEQYKPEVMESMSLKEETIKAVKEGLAKVTSENGTASTSFQGFPIKTGGKTGSATFSEKQNAVGRTSYGVYLGFAPFDKPEIAVCVVIFDGGHGGYVSDVARAIYEGYFRDRIKVEYPYYTPKYDYTFKD